MKLLAYTLSSLLLFNSSLVAQDTITGPSPVDACRKAAKPTWDKGGRGNLYSGNDEYRTCMKTQIQKLAKDVLPADKQAEFNTQMEAAADQITQAYNLLDDQMGKAGHRKAIDDLIDGSDLCFYEGLLDATYAASEVMKGKMLPAPPGPKK